MATLPARSCRLTLVAAAVPTSTAVKPAASAKPTGIPDPADPPGHINAGGRDTLPAAPTQAR